MSGAILGATGGGGFLLATAGGAAAGLAEYGMDCAVNGLGCDAEGALGAAAGGALGGAVGWGVAKVGGKIIKAVAGKFGGSAARGAEAAGGRAVARGAGAAGGRAAAETAEASFASWVAGVKAARLVAAEAKELAAKKAAADAAAAEAKRAAEEAAYQRWLATPPGRALQAARNEGADVTVARTAQAADHAVPTAALPAQLTPSLSENLLRATGTVGDNAAAGTIARAPVGRSGAVLADATETGTGRASGGLGNGGSRNVYRSKPDGRPNEYPTGTVVSLGRLKQFLARAGYRAEWDRYSIVQLEKIYVHGTEKLAEGNSPHGWRGKCSVMCRTARRTAVPSSKCPTWG